MYLCCGLFCLCGFWSFRLKRHRKIPSLLCAPIPWALPCRIPCPQIVPIPQPHQGCIPKADYSFTCICIHRDTLGHAGPSLPCPAQLSSAHLQAQLQLESPTRLEKQCPDILLLLCCSHTLALSQALLWPPFCPPTPLAGTHLEPHNLAHNMRPAPASIKQLLQMRSDFLFFFIMGGEGVPGEMSRMLKTWGFSRCN